MTSSTQQNKLYDKLAALYQRMEDRYNHVAKQLGLSCTACPDNCCVSYFQHHTYIEWAYLWNGLMLLSQQRREIFLKKAQEYLQHSQQMLEQGKTPDMMCPLNEQGKCQLYPYRLMVCRLHGVPNKVTMPDGRERHFPGCHICQQLTSGLDVVPALDRTDMYYDLARLEREFTQHFIRQGSRINLTLAEMLVKGPPID
jgi:hypothetical protein